MLSEKETIRYSRHLLLLEIGINGQEKLKSAKVLVVGAGGLGCPVLQYLVAAGVGIIGVADSDKIDESNLHRQVLYSQDDIGKKKVDVAKKKLMAQNPFVQVIAHDLFLSPSTILSVIEAYDIVIDGSDNFPTRYLVNDACVVANKVLVFGSIFRFQGQVSVFNYKSGSTYRCLYPEPPLAEEMPNCSEAGVMGVLPGITGTLMANEVIKIITGVGEVLSGKLLSFDALKMDFNTFSFDVQASSRKVKILEEYESFCGNEIKEITAADLKTKIIAKEIFQLVDVRERKEYELKNIGGLLLPLSEIDQHLHELRKDVPVIIHCQAGTRSKKAVRMLQQKGFTNLSSLKNGLLDF